MTSIINEYEAIARLEIWLAKSKRNKNYLAAALQLN